MKNIIYFLVVSTLAFSGCARTEASRFYLLSPQAVVKPIGDQSGQQTCTFTVSPVRLPEYLNRSQIVTRRSENELVFGWSDRWGESLERNVSRVLEQNMERLLHSGCVFGQGTKTAMGHFYRVDVDVIRMDGVLGQKACLEARWGVSSKDRKTLLAKRSYFEEPVKASGYEEFVQAQSRVLHALSHEIAAAIDGLRND